MNNRKLLLAIGLTLVAAGCRSPKEKESKAVYTTTSAEITDISVPKDYVGNIQSEKNIELRAQKQGILQEIYVDEGQAVKAGQELFRIETVGAQEEVEKTQADAEQARIDFQNASTLATNNIVSKNARKMAGAKLRAALADYRFACLRKRQSIVRAPFAGIIGRIPKKKGSVVEEGDMLSTLSDNSNIYVYFNVSEPEYLDYEQHVAERNKLPLSLILANGTEFGARGHLQNVEGEFDNSTGNIAFRAKFPNSSHLLRNGETGTVRMNVPLRKAMVIPQQATYEVQDRKYVFVADARGYVHSRLIKVIYETQNVFVVSGGLTQSDRFLLEGVDKVNDGDRVTCRYEKAKAAMQSIKLKID